MRMLSIISFLIKYFNQTVLPCNLCFGITGIAATYDSLRRKCPSTPLSRCWSEVGDQHVGQNLSVGLGCDYKAIIEHEILHALGFYHEQSRTDRDDYVNIWWDEVLPGVYGAEGVGWDCYSLSSSTRPSLG